MDCLSLLGIRDRLSTSNFVTYRGLGANGRLGNQLWQILSTIGIARKYGKNLVLPSWKYEKSFSFPADFFSTTIPFFAIESTYFVKYLKSQAVYLQDLSLVEDLRVEMLAWTLPSEKIKSYVDNNLKTYDLTRRHAMHVRRGDYVSLSSYHSLPTIDWFKKQIKESTLIFTDDPIWCAQQFPGVDLFEGDEVLSFHSMRLCNEFTISASSFSWWAAFLSGSSQVVYPKPWSQVNLLKWNTELFIPNHFRGLPMKD